MRSSASFADHGLDPRAMNQNSPVQDGPTTGVTLVRALLAVGAVLAMLLLSMAVRPLVPYTQMSLFYLAVLFSARLGGFALGAFSVALSVVAAELVLFPPTGISLADLLTGRLAAWITVALGVAFVVDRLTLAQRRASEQQREAERLATELRQQAIEMTARAEDARALALELEKTNVRLTEQSDTLRLAAARSERLQRFTAQLLGRVGAASVANLIVDEGRRAVDASAAALVFAREGDQPDVVAAHGFPEDAMDLDRLIHSGRTPLLETIETGEPIWLEDEATLSERYPQLVEQQQSGRSWAALPLSLDGRRIGALALVFPRAGPFTPDDRAFMLLIAQQCAQAVERARLHDMELRARIRAEFAERRLSLLADASARLAASLDYLASLANLAHIVVPEIADWCVVHLIDDNGTPRLIAVAHTDPDLVTRRRELEDSYPSSLQDQTAQAQALRTGEVVSIEPVTDDYLRGIAQDHVHLDALRSFDVRSQLSVPLRIEDRV
jgi:GAF domain-containing protein